MSSKRPTRRLLACAALSAGVLLGSGAASAETPTPARAPFAELLQAALRVISAEPTAPGNCELENLVELEPPRRMGNTKGPAYTDRAAQEQVSRARPVQARTPARTAR